MNVTAAQYAQALYDATVEGSDVDRIVNNFVKEVYQSGDLGKIPDIMSNFSHLYNKQEGIEDVTVTSRAELDKETKKTLEKSLTSIIDATLNVTYATDSTIIGGVKVSTSSKLVDMTVNRQLEDFISSN